MAVSWSWWHWLTEALVGPSRESPELLEHRLLLLGQHKYPATQQKDKTSYQSFQLHYLQTDKSAEPK